MLYARGAQGIDFLEGQGIRKTENVPTDSKVLCSPKATMESVPSITGLCEARWRDHTSYD